MLTRITLMFVVIAALCSTAFTIGTRAAQGQTDASGIPTEHALALALRYKQELALTPDQVDKLSKLHDDMAKEFAPLRDQATQLQKRMEDLQQSASPDPDVAKKIQAEAAELGPKMQAVFERYGKSVGDILTPEQREKLQKLSEANVHKPQGKDFALTVIMESREQLGITPQQFTKLQYLQADFIRAFAPLREKMELLQLEVQEKFGKAGKEPTPDYLQLSSSLQKQIADLQAQFSDRAINEVLEPKQKAKLGELLNGEHRSAPNGA